MMVVFVLKQTKQLITIESNDILHSHLPDDSGDLNPSFRTLAATRHQGAPPGAPRIAALVDRGGG